METDTYSQTNNMVLVRPKIGFDEAKQIIFDLYGLKVNKIWKLNGYDDQNFNILVNRDFNNNNFITNINKSGYLLKIINTLDSQNDDWMEAQAQLLLHLYENNIRCPKTVLTKDQKPYHKISLSTGDHTVRLLEYISGKILFNIHATSKLFYEVGVLTAEMDNALKTFDHPAYHRSMQWCLGAAPDILEYLCDAVKDQERQDLVKTTIKEFSSRVLTIEDRLSKGIIHGDINEQNLIIEEVNNEFNVKAIIDFGDVHYTCHLYELAIAMTYMIFTSNDIDNGGFVLAGYTSARSVTEEELKLLRICIMTRFCQSLVIGAHASMQEPDNEYILTTSKKGWGLLESMDKISETALLDQWMSIVKSSNVSLM